MRKFSRSIFKIFAVVILVFSALDIAYAQSDWMSEAIMNLQSHDPAVRLEAVRKLRFQRADRAREALISVLNDPNDEVRRDAVGTLGDLKDKRATGAIVPLIHDKDGEVRANAIRALGNIGDSEAVEPLVEALSKAGLGYQSLIIDALGALDDPRAVQPLFNLRGTDVGDAALRALGKSAVEPMCEILTRDQSPDRWYAVSVLERVADARAMDSLISVLGVGENAIGRTAANALAWRIGKPAIPDLIAASKNSDPRVRANAVLALAHIPEDEVTGTLVLVVSNYAGQEFEAFGDPPDDWSKPRDERVIGALIEAMGDKDADVRLTALKGIAGLERTDVLAALVNAMSDPVTSTEASIVLGSHRDLRALPYLFRILAGSDPHSAGRAERVLAEIGTPAIDGLISILTDKNKEFPLREIRRQKWDSKNSFRFRCGNEPPPPILDPRVLAAFALGQIGDERARQPLTAAVKDKASWLHNAAVAALERLDRKKISSYLP